MFKSCPNFIGWNVLRIFKYWVKRSSLFNQNLNGCDPKAFTQGVPLWMVRREFGYSLDKTEQFGLGNNWWEAKNSGRKFHRPKLFSFLWRMSWCFSSAGRFICRVYCCIKLNDLEKNFDQENCSVLCDGGTPCVYVFFLDCQQFLLSLWQSIIAVKTDNLSNSIIIMLGEVERVSISEFSLIVFGDWFADLREFVFAKEENSRKNIFIRERCIYILYILNHIDVCIHTTWCISFDKNKHEFVNIFIIVSRNF